MEKIWIGFIIFLCGAAMICAASVNYAYEHNYDSFRFIWGFRMVSLKNTKEFPAEEIENINIAYSSQNIIFLKEKADKIVIKEYLRSDSKDTSRIEMEENTLYVQRDVGINEVFLFGTERIEIYLPESYRGNIKVAVSSGNITADSVWSFNEFDALAKSGNITCDEIEAQKITAAASSGNITFGKAQGIRYLMTSSGNIRVSAGVGDTYAEAISGNIDVEGASGNFKASTHSGNIKAEFNSLGKTVEAETNSGNIHMYIPKDSAFSYEASAGSGLIVTNFKENLSYNEKRNKASGTYGENIKTAITTSTTSGNAFVKLQ